MASEAKPYLQRLAEALKDETRRIVVLPNRRSMFVLKDLIGDRDDITLITIDDLMEMLSGLQLIEPEELQVSFYEAYSRHEANPQSFDQFSTWAITFLSDVNDVDLHLGDVEALFKHIDAYHRTGEGFGNAGPIEQDFLRFWERLPKYYTVLLESLDQLKLGYRGLLYRRVAEKADRNAPELQEYFADTEVCWVGIIPGNPSERALLDWIQANGSLKLFADVDAFYIDDAMHEAGRLFRSHPIEGDVHWKVDLLASEEKRIDVLPVPGKMAQLTRLRSMLSELAPSAYRSTVVVLADTTLLIPFLEMFSDMKDRINVTQGFSMRDTLVHRFVMSWMHLHATSIKRDGNRLFYHKHLDEFLNYPIVDAWLAGAIGWPALKKSIVESNHRYIPMEQLHAVTETDLFAQQAFTLLFDWDDQLEGVFDRMTEVLQQWKAQTKQLGISRIEEFALDKYIQKLKLLMSQFQNLLPGNDVRQLKTFVHRQVGYSKLYLEEPKNDAIQVMGMLETRMIDFERVFVLGASDDELPGNPPQVTHIPFIHRLHFKLPTRKDREALTSYHFYRLIQRAKDVTMIYSTTADRMSSGEPSRYIRQIEDDLALKNPNLQFRVHTSNVQVKMDDMKPLRVFKDEGTIKDIRAFFKRSVSPSALNKYVRSPLEFYFYHVLNLKEQEEVEEDIEVRTFGTIVHNALEDLYKPFVGKVISPEALKKALPGIDALVEAKFEEKFPKEEFSTGRNYIALRVAQDQVRAFVEFDLKEMESAPITLLSLEERLRVEVEIAGERLVLFGMADRIERKGGEIRIIDYKTGKVESKNLRFIPEELHENTDLDKALQLAMYQFMYCRREGCSDEHVNAYIYSFKSEHSHYQGLNTKPSKDESYEVLEEMPGVLETFVRSMLDPTEPFEHKEDSKYVTF